MERQGDLPRGQLPVGRNLIDETNGSRRTNIESSGFSQRLSGFAGQELNRRDRYEYFDPPRYNRDAMFGRLHYFYHDDFIGNDIRRIAEIGNPGLSRGDESSQASIVKNDDSCVADICKRCADVLENMDVFRKLVTDEIAEKLLSESHIFSEKEDNQACLALRLLLKKDFKELAKLVEGHILSSLDGKEIDQSIKLFVMDGLKSQSKANWDTVATFLNKCILTLIKLSRKSICDEVMGDQESIEPIETKRDSSPDTLLSWTQELGMSYLQININRTMKVHIMNVTYGTMNTKYVTFYDTPANLKKLTFSNLRQRLAYLDLPPYLFCIETGKKADDTLAHAWQQHETCLIYKYGIKNHVRVILMKIVPPLSTHTDVSYYYKKIEAKDIKIRVFSIDDNHPIVLCATPQFSCGVIMHDLFENLLCQIEDRISKDKLTELMQDYERQYNQPSFFNNRNYENEMHFDLRAINDLKIFHPVIHYDECLDLLISTIEQDNRSIDIIVIDTVKRSGLHALFDEHKAAGNSWFEYRGAKYGNPRIHEKIEDRIYVILERITTQINND